MSADGVVSAFAILLAPLITIRISKLLDRRKEKSTRRFMIFRSLMATRASKLSFEHINALNMIDLEFSSTDDNSKKVVEAWRLYLSHLENKALLDGSLETWSSKGNDLFIELLACMAKCLNFDFDKALLQKTSYSPEAYGQAEIEQLIIRKGLTELFAGKNSIPIRITSDDSEMDKTRFRKLIEDYLELRNPVRVIILDKDDTGNR